MPIGVVAASLIRGRRFESNPGLLGIGHQQGLAVPGEIEALPVATVEAEVDRSRWLDRSRRTVIDDTSGRGEAREQAGRDERFLQRE